MISIPTVASGSSSAVHGFTSGSSNVNGPRLTGHFWQGSLRRVANDYVPDANSFTFKQALGLTDKLEMAFLSSLCDDMCASSLPRTVFHPNFQLPRPGTGSLHTF